MSFPPQLLLGTPVGTTAGAPLGGASIVYPADADYTLTTSGAQPESTRQFLQVTSTPPLTATRKLVVPLNDGQPWIVQNSTTGGQSILVIGPSGTGVLVPNEAIASVVCDGTNIYPLDSGASGPAPGTAAYNPSWYAVTDIYLDPVGGSDTNAGTSSSFPVKTMSEVIRRYGSSSPQIPSGQNLTIHQLSAQTLNVDVFFFDPQSDGGTLAWTGTQTAVGSPFSPSSIMARVRGNPGNQLGLVFGSLPAGINVGLFLYNTTRHSQAIIDSIAGLTAFVSQPVTNAGVEDNGWANTDTYQLFTPVGTNWSNPRPSGTNASLTISNIEFLGGGNWTASPTGMQLIFLNCQFDPVTPTFDGSKGILQIPADRQIPTGITLINCQTGPGSFSTQVYCFWTEWIGGTVQSFTTNSVAMYLNNSIVDGDANFYNVDFSGHSTIGALNILGLMQVVGGETVLGGLYSGNHFLWGAGDIDVNQGGKFLTSVAWTNVTTATITLEGFTTAWTPPATGTFTNNGVTQVNTAGVNGTNAFPTNAPISISLKTVGGAITAQPYFSQAQAANNFYTKASAGDTSVYNWTAGPGIDNLSLTNLANYGTMYSPFSGSMYGKYNFAA